MKSTNYTHICPGKKRRNWGEGEKEKRGVAGREKKELEEEELYPRRKMQRISAGLYFSSQNKHKKEMSNGNKVMRESVYAHRILNLGKLFLM